MYLYATRQLNPSVKRSPSNMKSTALFALMLGLFLTLGLSDSYAQKQAPMKTPIRAGLKVGGDGKVHETKDQWKKLLAPEEYQVMFEEGTERPFTGKLLNEHTHGVFLCNACKYPLFASETKFESGTGWPSFYQPISKKAVDELTDADGSRTEVRCERCGAHLGHVFNDGPKPTGLRYCMNSVALDFKKQ